MVKEIATLGRAISKCCWTLSEIWIPALLLCRGSVGEAVASWLSWNDNTGEENASTEMDVLRSVMLQGTVIIPSVYY